MKSSAQALSMIFQISLHPMAIFNHFMKSVCDCYCCLNVMDAEIISLNMKLMDEALDGPQQVLINSENLNSIKDDLTHGIDDAATAFLEI